MPADFATEKTMRMDDSPLEKRMAAALNQRDGLQAKNGPAESIRELYIVSHLLPRPAHKEFACDEHGDFIGADKASFIVDEGYAVSVAIPGDSCVGFAVSHFHLQSGEIARAG